MKTKLFAITVICLLASSIARAEQHSKDVQVQDVLKHYASEMINKYKFDVPESLKNYKPDDFSMNLKQFKYDYSDNTEFSTDWRNPFNRMSIYQLTENGHREFILENDQLHFRFHKTF